MGILSDDLELLKTQYKEQQNTLQKRSEKIEDLAHLCERATAEAEKFKELSRDKDTQIASLFRQLDEKKRQLTAAQNRIKALTTTIMAEITKQLESKIKETEMLKEMLRSSKIELSGKEKEIKRLRSKLGTAGYALKRERAAKQSNESSPQKGPPPIKSVSMIRDSRGSSLP